MYSQIMTVKPKCQYNGQGCKDEDTCYLSDKVAWVSCGLYLYFNFLDNFNEAKIIDDFIPDNMFDTDKGAGLSQCPDVKQSQCIECPDLVPSGKCLDQLIFCPLMEYKAF